MARYLAILTKSKLFQLVILNTKKVEQEMLNRLGSGRK